MNDDDRRARAEKLQASINALLAENIDLNDRLGKALQNLAKYMRGMQQQEARAVRAEREMAELRPQLQQLGSDLGDVRAELAAMQQTAPSANGSEAKGTTARKGKAH